MPRQMSSNSAGLFRAIVTMTETVEGREPKTYSPQVFGPHETLSPVKAAVTRYRNSLSSWHRGSGQYGHRADGGYGQLEVERVFKVEYQTVTIEWKPVDV